ncbi:ankyrin and armadillo repeat-containing protein isoform X2 [Xenopus tropicalis]|uniref:Ankyrin and armadillo repeat-containing protein isoform X2 n=1 Tax=Xenopus tropicalis TaxID=8364 RepID=A0A8J1IVY8_XENTR|nr:ankyrin and armadillo repeat-containing protein isoform X2 [Xenopus tropicalis]
MKMDKYRSVKMVASKPPVKDETFIAEMSLQRNAHAFFERFSQSEIQELLVYTTSSWLANMEDIQFQLPSGLICQMKNQCNSSVFLLAPVESEVRLDYRDVHQIIRELAVGIYCFNQVPSISLDANYDRSTSCNIPPAYCDTRVGQIMIAVDYMMKALWHGAFMAKDKRVRFSEFWRSNMNIDANGIPLTKKDVFADFCAAGLTDISSDPDYEDIYSQTPDFDPSYEPNNEEEKNLFMQYADSITIKMTCFITDVQQCENFFIYDASNQFSTAIRLTEEYIDPVTYQRLQQRLKIQRKLVAENIEKTVENRKNVAYLKLISFLVPFFLGLKKKMKVPDLNHLLQPFSNDKLKTERELPPLMLGENFACQHFQYGENEYFHLHGGIEFDLGTPSLEQPCEDIKAAFQDIKITAIKHINDLLDLDTTYREYYPIPTVTINGKSYYTIAIQLENFYPAGLKTHWWGAINGIISTLKPKRLPLTDVQMYEQFKKRFGYKRAIKCQNFPFGLKSAAKRGLAAVFHTFSRKTQISGLDVRDEAGYAVIHHAAIYNRVVIVSQLAKASFNLNQRRNDSFLVQANTSTQNLEDIEQSGPTALHIAAQCGSLEVLLCLLALKTDYMLRDNRGWMAIHFAAFYGAIPCIRALYRNDPNLLEMETTAQYQCTPLLLTAAAGELDALHYLLSVGANWKQKDSLGNNIIDLAVLYFHTNILKYIIDLNIPELHVWQQLAGLLKCDDQHRKEMAVRCLEVLCVVNRNYWEDIYKAGTIPSLVELLHSDQVPLKCLALGILSNISNNNPVSRALVKSGAIQVLVHLLHSRQPELQSRCSVLLSDIAQIDSNQNVIAEMDGISPLVHLLYEKYEDVLVNAVNCIRVLCIKNTANQKAVRDLGAIPSLVEFLTAKSDILVSAATDVIAELARDNKAIQDAVTKEGVIESLISILRVRNINIQVKAAMTIEALCDHNPAVQKEFLTKSVTKHISKLLKVFQLEVREQGSTTLWALAGQTRKQQKAMAEYIGYKCIIDMLLSPSDKMQYIGGEAIIALCKDSRHYQCQICEGNGIGPLVRLLRSPKVANGTLIRIIKALGIMCIGVAFINNPVAQEKIVEENAIPTLLHLLKTQNSLHVKAEVACTLACIVLRNSNLQDSLKEMEDVKYSDILDLLYASDKAICLRAGYALSLFAYSSTMQQFNILENGGIKISIYEPFLQSDIEPERALAAFQIVVLAKVISDMDQITLCTKGVTVLTELLQSKNPTTLVLTGELLATLAHIRTGIPEAITTLGTVKCLCNHLYSPDEEVRIACANALGYLTFNRTASRHLLAECRTRPCLYNLLISNLSEDARMSKTFTDEFKIQKQIGLPSLR